MKLKHVILLFICALLISFLSCESEKGAIPFNDEVEENFGDNNPLAEIQFIESKFSLNNFQDSFELSKNDFEINWNTYVAQEFEGQIWYEFQIQMNNQKELISDVVFNVNYSLLASVSESDDVIFYINKMASFSNTHYRSYFSLKEKYFTGMVYFINLEGISVVMEYFEKGDTISRVVDESFETSFSLPMTANCTQRHSLTAACENTWNCPPPTSPTGGCGGSGTGSGQYVLRYTAHYTDWYLDRNGDGVAQSAEYSTSDFNGYTSEWVWVSGNGGSNTLYDSSWSYYLRNDSGSVNRLNTNPAGLVQPDRIIISILTLSNTKALCAYNKLMNSMMDGHNLFASFHMAFSDLHSQNWDYHLQGENDLEVNGIPVNATTQRIGGRKVQTTINLSTLGYRSSLEVARTLLHEALHAMLIRHYNSGTSSFMDLFGDYLRDYHGANTIHHQIIVDNYIDIMAATLQQYDNNQNDFSFYQDIAWGGFPDIADQQTQDRADAAATIARAQGLNCN